MWEPAPWPSSKSGLLWCLWSSEDMLYSAFSDEQVANCLFNCCDRIEGGVERYCTTGVLIDVTCLALGVVFRVIPTERERCEINGEVEVVLVANIVYEKMKQKSSSWMSIVVVSRSSLTHHHHHAKFGGAHGCFWPGTCMHARTWISLPTTNGSIIVYFLYSTVSLANTLSDGSRRLDA